MILGWINMYCINLGEWWIRDGKHDIPDNNLILIQITSPNDNFIESPYKHLFYNIYRFKFDDITLEDTFKYPELLDLTHNLKLISEQQSLEIAQILINAEKDNKNVIVSCQAGISRSGAIAQVAEELLGFEPNKQSCLRHPNKYVYATVRDKILELMNE